MHIRLCLLLMLLAPAIRAQDIRLVPPHEGYLPIGDAAIEAAARSGNFSLAVWGSVVADTTPAGTRNILRMQLFRGTGIAGEQKTITVAQAMPYGSVRVLSLRDGFLVVWNDRRPGAPGIYLQKIDTTGRVRTEEALSGSPVSYRRIMAGGSAAAGYMILWEEQAEPHHLHARRIDADGKAVEPEITLDGSLLEEVRTALLPGVTILRIRDDNGNEARGYMIRDGRLDPRRIPAAKLSGQDFHIGADTSAARLDHLSTLWIYRSLFDSLSQGRVELDADFEGQATLTRDTAGRYLFHIWDVLDDPRFPLHAIVNRVIVTDTVQSGLETVADREHLPSPPPGWKDSTGHFTGVGWQRRCGGKLLTFSYAYTGVDDAGRPARRIEYDRYLVDPYGRLVEGGTGEELDCSDIAIKRIPSAGSSLVAVGIDGVETEIGHLLANVEPLPRQGTPNIVTEGGYPTLALQNNTPPAHLELLRFDGSFASDPRVDARFDTTGRSLQVPGVLLSWRETSRIESQGSDTIYSRGFALSKGSGFGWYTTGTVERSGPTDRRFRPIDVSYDPNTDQAIAAVELPGPEGSRRIAVLTVGGSSWRIDSLPNGPAGDFRILPVVGEQFFVIVRDTATLFTPFGPIGRVILSPAPPEATFRRLLGNRILRSYFADSARGLYTIEILDLQGSPLARRTVTLAGATAAPYVVEHPSGTSLALLYPADGIRLSWLDAALRPLALEIPIGENRTGAYDPAGAFLRDTLHVVWTDTRSGGGEIYGSWWKPAVTVGVREAGGTRRSLSVAPNPASGHLSLLIESKRAESTTVEIIDMRGESVRRHEITLGQGSNLHELDLTGLPAGAYTVVIGSASTRIIVQ